MRTALLACAGMILASFLLSIYAYPLVPEDMTTHWGAAGEPNGSMPKLWGLLFLPLMSAALLLLFFTIPKIDPLKSNIKKFRAYFDWFVLIFTGFFLYLQALVIVANLGSGLNMVQFMMPALGVLFYYAGVLIGKAKRNWFIGIRTPWTMSSDRVWDSTHRLGGKLFRACGVIAFLSVLVPAYSLWLVLGPVIASSAYLIIYSYIEYGRQGRKR